MGGSPTFEAVDGSGIVVAAKLISGSGLAPRSGDGGFGSVGDVLLRSTSSRGSFRWALHEQTGQLAVRLQPGSYSESVAARHGKTMQSASGPWQLAKSASWRGWCCSRCSICTHSTSAVYGLPECMCN